MSERLTKIQMSEKYPNQWLGLTNVKYKDNDGITLESAEIVYIDKTEDELFSIQIDTHGKIYSHFTGEPTLSIGVIHNIAKRSKNIC